jgi:hypothetical protein
VAASHHPVAPALVLVTLHESALHALVKAADETLTASRGQPEADRRQRRYVGRERILFTTRERIIQGDFHMLRAPSDPPELREVDGRARFFAVPIEFDLTALSAEESAAPPPLRNARGAASMVIVGGRGLPLSGAPLPAAQSRRQRRLGGDDSLHAIGEAELWTCFELLGAGTFGP